MRRAAPNHALASTTCAPTERRGASAPALPGKQRVNQCERTNWQRLCFSHDPSTATISHIVLERGVII